MRLQRLCSVLAIVPISSFTPISKAPFVHKSVTSLHAINVLARKAKENEIQQYLDAPPPDSVLDYLSIIQSPSSAKEETSDHLPPLQDALTRRKGTITVIAEYKRRLDKGAFIDEVYDCDILSPSFREFGATAVAILADKRMGGCDYEDIIKVKKEQESARGDVPGPCFVISSDIIVNEVQIAQSKDAGADAVFVNFGLLSDEEKVGNFLKACKKLDMECIVGVSTNEEAKKAVELGGRILCVVGINDVDEKTDVVSGLDVGPGGEKICTVASIIARDDKALDEVEEAWVLRDKGFNAVWVSDCLYKSGNDAWEHPGAIIRSMKAKSSVKYASVKAMGGKGEGAKEYLGDIMM